MYLKVNGESVDIKDGSNIEDLLNALEIPKTNLAVELNGKVIPNSELMKRPLQDMDVLEIVRAIGGG